MKDQLVEAKDHKVVVEKTDDKGVTIFQMKYGSNVLEKIVNGTLLQTVQV